MHELNDNKIITMQEKYPCLITETTNVELWWNSLGFLQRVEVGSIAMHYNKMSANYKWKCYDTHSFDTLTKGQKNIVKFVFSKRNDNWYMFDVSTLLKLN